MTCRSDIRTRTKACPFGQQGLRQFGLGLGLLALITLPAQAQKESPGNPTLIRGEVVETGCFVIGDRHGPDHRQCAIACARAGQDLGILDEETGLLHIEIRDQRDAPVPSALLGHVAERVEVRGRGWQRGGLQGIEIRQVQTLGARAAH